MPKELKEYAEYEMMTIWSEYFAERCAYSVIQNSNPPSEDEIKELLADIISQGVVADTSNIFRLLYWFVLYIAYFHSRNEDYSLSIENNCQDIIVLLNELDDTLKRLYNESGNWRFEPEYVGLGKLFITIYELKYLT